MAKAGMDLLWLGVGAVAIWYIWGNGMGGIFNTSLASGEMQGNPTTGNGNGGMINGLLYGTGGDVYSGNPIQTISGTWHL
jgi:hypothetical protein